MNFASIDHFATELINGWSGHLSVLDGFMAAVSNYGHYVMIAAVVIRWWWNQPANKLHERHLAMRCGFAVILGLLIKQMVLLFVQRMSIYEAGLAHLFINRSTDSSFPSGHATLIFAHAFSHLSARARRGWVFLFAALVLAVSYVYVGAHHVLDMVGGFCIGLIAAVVIQLVYREGSRLDRWATRIL